MPNFYWPPDARTKHLYIPGRSGYGKTSIMANLALGDIEENDGPVCVIDPKGSKEGLVERIIAHLPEDRIKDTFYISFKHPVPINFMGYDDEDEKTRVTNDVITILKRFASFGSWGSNLQGFLKRVVPTLLEAKDTTFLDVGNFFESKKRQDEILKQVSQKRFDYWHENKPSKNDTAPVCMRMSNFIESKPLATIMGAQRGVGLDIPTLISRNKILLIDTSPISEDGLMLGALMMSKIQQAIFRRDPDKEHARCYVYADEFHNFLTSAFSVLMSQARSFNLSLCVANQHPAQVKEIIDDIKGCISSYLIFQMTEEHARIFKSELRDYPYENIADLPVGKAVYVAANRMVEELTTPDPPERTDAAYSQYIKKRIVENSACNTPQASHTEGNGNPPDNDEPDEPSGPPPKGRPPSHKS